jgi:hypothetical protein
MTNYEQLEQLISISGNCVNLGRTIKAKYPALYDWVLSQTTFLNHKQRVSVNERIYCIIHKIHQQVINAWGEPAKFINLFSGYSLKVILKLKSDNKKIKTKRPDKAKLDKLSKLDQFKERNRKRNSHLYYAHMEQDVDYVVCPISHERMSMIRDDYIKNILGLDPETYWSMHPHLPKCSLARRNNIKQGLSAIDPETGLTKHAKSINNAKITKITPDQNGETIYQKIGQKTRAAHMANVDSDGQNGYQRLAKYRVTTIMPDGRRLEDHAHEKRSQSIAHQGFINKKRYGASKLSKKHLAPVLCWLNEHNISYYFDNNEFVVRDQEWGRNYLYDLVVPSLGLVVEYQSLRYHAWPLLSNAEWLSYRQPFSNLSADKLTCYERQKAKVIYHKYGYLMWYVWEPTATTDVSDIICYLKTLIMKS